MHDKEKENNLGTGLQTVVIGEIMQMLLWANSYVRVSSCLCLRPGRGWNPALVDPNGDRLQVRSQWIPNLLEEFKRFSSLADPLGLWRNLIEGTSARLKGGNLLKLATEGAYQIDKYDGRDEA